MIDDVKEKRAGNNHHEKHNCETEWSMEKIMGNAGPTKLRG
jgi:hypothetical protein